MLDAHDHARERAEYTASTLNGLFWLSLPLEARALERLISAAWQMR